MGDSTLARAFRFRLPQNHSFSYACVSANLGLSFGTCPALGYRHGLTKEGGDLLPALQLINTRL